MRSSTSQRGWRGMSKHFRTSRQPCMILMLIPFDISSPKLKSLQSGLGTSPRHVHDFKTALVDGKFQVKILLQERVFTKTRPLSATIHKHKRQTFAYVQIWSPSGAVLKVAHMERQALTALVYLAERTGELALESALEGRVTEECISMYNINGSMQKASCWNSSTLTQ